MNKYRIHEVAKDFDVPSKEVMQLLAERFPDVARNHMMALEENELDVIFDYFTKKNELESFEKYFASGAQAKPQTDAAQSAPEAQIDAAQSGEKPAAAPAAPAQPRPAGGEKPQAAKPQGEAAFKRKVRIVDTRTSSVDLNKFDEHIDELIPEKAGKAMETDRIKQRIGPSKGQGQQGGQRQGHPAGGRGQQGGQRQGQPFGGGRGQQNRGRRGAKPAPVQKRPNPVPRQPLDLTLPEEMTVGELAMYLKLPATEVIKKLMSSLGIMAPISQVIDYDTAALIAEEFGAKVKKEVIVTTEERLIDDSEDKAEDLQPRSPVVVVMGHVDHGKTSLLDAIRNAHVAAGEAGGITQHIGAYRVRINDQDITFLDTPGHEAFTAMRARGAQVTDIAILVVAADDGIMPQTIEAINHAKAAGVSIIVAINKIDRENADVERVKQELTEYELVPEEWGGDTICVPCSAVKKQGIDELLEMVLLTAEMRELKANPNRKASGTVIESRLDKGRGPVATVLVQNGTLSSGDVIIAGTAVGRVRVMTDDKGRRIQKAGPSVPVEIVGLSETPNGGDLFHAVDDEKLARELAEERKQKIKDERNAASQGKISLDDLFAHIKEGEMKNLNIVVKADVQGSVEAVRQALEKLSNEEVKVRCIHGAVGAINESDVMLAAASQAIIVGFNVRPDAPARVSADMNEVDIRTYRVIYDAIDEIGAAMRGMLAPQFRENVLGHAEVRQTYKVSGVGTIAGCYVQDGKIARNAQVRIVRDGIVIHEGSIESLKRFKDDAREVAQGFECGISIEKFNDIKEGDVIEAFVMEEIKQQ